MIAAERRFADRERLALHLASDVASALRRAVDGKGCAVIAVSGGTTPVLFFEKLSRFDLPWDRVVITLVDERQVPERSDRSNARLVRQHLLQDKAAAARFVPLFANPAASDLPPFDVVVLGMGNDGHTASFFPGGDRLAEALSLDGAASIVEINSPGAGEPRLTFTLPRLLAASSIMLHIEGPEKHATLEKARQAGPVENMPVRAVLESQAPVTIYWCR